MSHFFDQLKKHVLVCDGSMGALIQMMDLDIEKDYMGKENCTEVLIKSRPDVIRDIHRQYYAAGADMVETDTFGASSVTLAEFDLADECFALNKRGAELAREAAEEFTDGRTRFVVGSVGPGTKLPSLGHISYDALEAGYKLQCEGLIAGTADALLIETCQDPLQIKAAINGAKLAREASGKAVAIMAQVTVESTGTLLVGADIAAAATVVHSLDVDVMGMNCATGPREMAEHVRWLSQNWPGFISIQPNAGLPELVDGKTVFPLSPEELARWHGRFVQEDGINIVGGCCGTTPAHITAVDNMLRKIGDDWRPEPVQRKSVWMPSLASLFGQTAIRQENAFLSIGERCNANGSKKFRDLVNDEDWDSAVALGRDQERTGAHTLDVCIAYVGRDEMADMEAIVSRMRGSVQTPLVFDSTSTKVLESALKLYGGKGIINSINFEDGEKDAIDRLKLAKKYGSAMIALTIDEVGMAKDCATKVKIAKRLHDVSCNKMGLPDTDLFIDPLTFTICTGNEDDRKLAIETLDAIEQICKELPNGQIVLGLSNISFGLKPVARHVLNAVFLDEALKRGMSSAIVHVGKLMPIHKIPENEKQAALDLIYDNRKEGYDPLAHFMSLFENKKVEKTAESLVPKTPAEKLKQRIVDGNRSGLEADINAALVEFEPLHIINNILLAGMKVVGELFGSGQMQLPFVLQSAETMKASVALLEPHMEKTEGTEKGKIVLATVKGDVHDIGKNLVDIILTNNGYKVVNLGIKQTVGSIIEAVKEHKPDAVGMSGLLVKSTVIMKDNLKEMTEAGIEMPVLLGGAALTRRYVEEDCTDAYGSGRVAYAKDAFEGLDLMAKIADGEFNSVMEKIAAKKAKKAAMKAKVQKQAKTMKERPVEFVATTDSKSNIEKLDTIPEPPFYGTKIIDHVPMRSLLGWINERMLYQVQWGYRPPKGAREQQRKNWELREMRPVVEELLKRCEDNDLIMPTGVYGYWKCASQGNDVILFDETGEKQVGKLSFPRQNKPGGLCIADFFRSLDDSKRDVIALQAVTIGPKASEFEKKWFRNGEYLDYLHLHGLSVEMAEAMAEHVHFKIREELGVAHEDVRDKTKLLVKQGYHGSRYSFGYPACPDLSQNRTLIDLLDASRIGLSISDATQMHPEQSTSAIVVHHPVAKYFAV